MKPHGPTPTDSSDVASGDRALRWIVERGGAEAVARQTRARAARRRRMRTGLACGTLAIMAIAGLFWSQGSREDAPLPASVTLTVPRNQQLPDGSSIQLKDDAQVAVAYDEQIRRITLTAGEALFQVAAERSRPFVVRAGPVEVRALGTAFVVTLGAETIDVLVTEGAVQVGSHEPGAPPLATLHAGNRVSLPAVRIPETPPEVTPMSESQQADALAWRVPRIEFSATPLSEALPVFNRYSSVRLILADPALGSVQLSGRLRPDRINPLILLLKNEFGIDAEPRGEREILLRKNSRTLLPRE